MTRWEYITKEFIGWNDLSVIHDLNLQGRKGWDLVTVLPAEIGKPALWLFKRRVPNTKRKKTK